MKVFTLNSVNPESVNEKEYKVKNGIEFENVSNYMRMQYLKGHIDGYVIFDDNNTIICQCIGARLKQ